MSRERSEPEKRSGKRLRSAESRRRAATYMHQLAWLEGFPDGDHWQRLDTGETIALDGTLVARSRRAARTVMREHPAALRELLGDVDRWWQLTDAKLAWCSTRRGELDLIDRAPARVARAAREAMADPSLRGAIVAAGIAWAQAPDVLERAVAWIVSHAAVAAKYDLVTTLQLARLVEDSGDSVDSLIALLEVDAPDCQPAVELVLNLVNRLRGKATKVMVAGRSAPRALAWMKRLATRQPEVQQRALALLAAIDLASALEPWARWEREHAARLERARAFVDRDFDRNEEAVHVERIFAGLEQVRLSAPLAVVIDEVLDAIDVLACEDLKRFCAPALRLLGAMPVDAGPVMRARMQIHLTRIAGSSLDARPAWLWDALSAALDRARAGRGVDSGILGPWYWALAKPGWSYLDDNILAPVKKRGEVQRIVGVLERLAPHALVRAEDAERAGAWVAAGLDETIAADVIIRLRAIHGELAPDVARAVLAIADGSPRDIVIQTAAMFAAIVELHHTPTRELMEFVQHAATTGGAWLVRDALANGQASALASAAGISALLPRGRWPAVVTPTRAPWIDRYPAVLAPALQRLASVDPDAEHTAARRLATDLPAPEDLRREIAALRAQAPRAPKRLANLEARLASPKLPSPARLQRLASKLDRTASTLGLARLAATITKTATDRLARTFGLPGPPPWPLDRRTQEILFGLLRLDEPERALAGRLLRARMGPPPWDLRDDPVNVAFVERVRARGLDLAPWLDDAPRTVIASDGKPLELALCGDPLEVFAMGAHFQTCLSPDASNFFSVIANASDINKRVLYVRRGGGVVGRCLLAITDSNALLAFHPYCHDCAIDLISIVRDYAVDLAARMRTTLAPSGAVSTLLARDWYDDGPRDLVGRFGGLERVRGEIEKMAPESIVAKLREALRHELDEITLPLVLAGLPELHARPELIVPLAPHFLATTTPATRIAAAELAMRAGDLVLADRLLADHGRTIRFDRPWPPGEVLAQLRPSLALARLRETRHRSVRRLSDEPGERLAVAGVALEALHRPTQAAAVYRLAIEKESHLRHDLGRRLRALGIAD